MNKQKTSEQFLTFEKKAVPIVILGLPGAGKTTFVNRMLTGRFTQPQPTMGVQFETYNVYDARINIFDLGGHETFRKTLWENYIRLAYGIVFVVDSTNEADLEEAKKEFWRSIELKNMGDEFLILFLCNKADLKESKNLEEIINMMELYKLAEIPNVSFQFFKTSMKTGKNFEPIMFWLKNKINKLLEQRKLTPLSILFSEKDGLPIVSITNKKVKQEPLLYSGFLSAIESFSKKAFSNGGMLQFLMTNQYKYVIFSTDKYIYSIMINADESHEEARRVIEIINEFVKGNDTDYPSIENFIIEAFKVDTTHYIIERTYR
ncbi:MAG: ADP-ribosylation factor-like protein [Candidatus Heimdallarchaeaceae archaeon]